jgi:hypothetical protein
MKLFDLLENLTNLSEIKKFIRSPQRNEWLEIGTMRVYVRKATHLIDKETAKTFDIASIEQDEDQRGKGEFRQLVVNLKKLLSDDALRGQIEGIYIENLLNDRLATSLPSMGFNLVPRTVPPCFYMKLK